MKLKIKTKLFIGLTSVILACLLTLIFYFGYKEGLKHKTIIVHSNFELTTESNNDSETWRYSFLPKEKSDYIEQLSKELQLDPDLAIAILIQENPNFDEYVTHINENGTIDSGFYQLNDKYVYSVFCKSFWDFEDVEFNVFNWKHNTFIALHQLKYLSETLKINDEVIMAYNAGAGAVMNERIPTSTYIYLARVKNTMELLKRDYVDRSE